MDLYILQKTLCHEEILGLVPNQGCTSTGNSAVLGDTSPWDPGAMQVYWSEENELLSRVHQHWWKYHLPHLKLSWLGSIQPRQSWTFLVLSLFQGLLPSDFNLFLLLSFLLLSCNVIILEYWCKSISFCLFKLELIYIEIPFFLYIQMEPCII